MASFDIVKLNGQFYYRFRANNNEIVQSSEGYTTKASCENGIASVKRHCSSIYFRKHLNGASYTFTHHAANGEVIGRSESYTTAAARDNGIDVVISQAPTAPTRDLT